MHASIAAIFAEHAKPKHCCKADVLNINKPLLNLAANMQRQNAEWRALLLDSETSVDLPDALRGKLEMYHQTLAAKERLQAEYTRAGRELTKAEVQWDRYMAELKSDIEAWEAGEAKRLAALAPAPAPAIGVPA